MFSLSRGLPSGGIMGRGGRWGGGTVIREGGGGDGGRVERI